MDVAAAAPVQTGRIGFRRLMASLGLASAALSALYAGAGTVLLPQQIENIDRPHKVAVLGVIAGVSAAFALVFNPIGGALSDRTRSRLGRRAPWLLGAPAALLIVAGWLGHVRTVPVILAAWCLAQSVVNFYQAPLTAVIPDRVAPARRGAASAVTGVASVVGGVAGVGVASLFTSNVSWGYLALGGLLAVTAVTFVLTTHDPSSAHLPPPPRDTRGLPARFAAFLSALTHRDFACVFASRAASIAAIRCADHQPSRRVPRAVHHRRVLRHRRGRRRPAGSLGPLDEEGRKSRGNRRRAGFARAAV
jgi:MFS family permease